MDEKRKLIRLSQEGNLEARNQLVEDNLALVINIVRRFRNRGIEYDDLVQIGCLGLLKAVRDFNFDFDVRFSTYAVPKIIGEIRQYLRKSSWVQSGRKSKTLASIAISTKDELTQKWGRTPTISELAIYLKISPEELVEAMDAAAPILYLQEKVDGGNGQSLEFQDLLAAYPDQENFFLRQALHSLQAEERKLILLRYFAEKSQTEVGQILGISQAQVSRIERRIVRDLRHKL
ncbi:MAG: sigma-70 family RNA polymerase sigma factor [Firmicutes bacterium]|nr:sigma-70 family RNA polymerase sigma factor [Bacillota bacterium]